MGRKRTLSIEALRREYRKGLEDPECSQGDDLEERPRTRADCIDGPRPCPWIGCKYNLWSEVNPKNGHLVIRFKDIEPHEMPPEASCALDIADRQSGQTIEKGRDNTIAMADLARLLGVTASRAQQVVEDALDRYYVELGNAFGGYDVPEE